MKLGIVAAGALVVTLAHAAGAAADPCDAARAHLAAGDLARASIAAAGCPEVAREVDRRAGAKQWSPVEVETDPAGGTVIVEGLVDAPFVAPRRIWLAPGRYQVTALVDGAPVASTWVTARDGDRAFARLSLPAPPPPTTDGAVDFGEEGGGEVASGPPPKQEFPSLLPDRYRRGLDGGPGGAATRARDRPPGPRRVGVGAWLPVASGRVGGGVAIRAGHDWGPLEVSAGVAAGSVTLAAAEPSADPDASCCFVARAGVDVLARGTVRLGDRVHARLGAGLAGAGTAGADTAAGAVTGVELGAVAAGEVVFGFLSLGVRVHTPLAATADVRVSGAGVLLGLRW